MGMREAVLRPGIGLLQIGKEGEDWVSFDTARTYSEAKYWGDKVE